MLALVGCILSAALSVAAIYAEWRWEHKSLTRHRVKMVCGIMAGIVAIACGVVAYRDTRRNDELLAAEKTRTERIQRDAAEANVNSGKLLEKATVAENHAKNILESCVGAWTEGRSMTDFLKTLEPAQVEGLRKHSCGAFPEWRKGGAQIRLFTTKTRAEAEARRGHLMNDVLFGTPGQNWSRHVTNIVESMPTDVAKRDHFVYVVALNQVQANLRQHVCLWLECMGVPPGEEECDTRPMDSVLAR
jgi:hypothetical protein